MRLSGIVLALADAIRKDPTILLSYAKLINELRNRPTKLADWNIGSGDSSVLPTGAEPQTQDEVQKSKGV